jgi:SNF2 family DNA or RNA helicase
VFVTHFIVSCANVYINWASLITSKVDGTIENRILEIQRRKTAIVKEAFRGSGSSGSDPESIRNLKMMFGD